MSQRLSSKPERICVICYRVFDEDLDLRRRVEALVEHGFDVTVLCGHRHGSSPDYAGTAAKILAVASVRSSGGTRLEPLGVARAGGGASESEGLWSVALSATRFACVAGARLLFEQVRRPFDHVEVDNPPDFLIFITSLLRLSGTRIVFKITRPDPEFWRDRMPAWHQRPVVALLGLVRRLGFRLAHRVIVNNRQMRQALAHDGADINRVSVVFDIAVAATMSRDDQQAVIDDVGRMRREERGEGAFRVVTHVLGDWDAGARTVLEAVAQLRDQLPGAECIVLSAGPAPALLERLQRLGISDRVRCLVESGDGDAVRRVAAADVCVVSRAPTPYNDMVLPPEVFKYVAMGKPIIASRLEATSSCFPEDSLLYFQPGDAEDLAAKIYRMFAHPEEVAARVANAAEVCEAHRWERERKKYVGVFKRSG